MPVVDVGRAHRDRTADCYRATAHAQHLAVTVIRRSVNVAEESRGRRKRRHLPVVDVGRAHHDRRSRHQNATDGAARGSWGKWGYGGRRGRRRLQRRWRRRRQYTDARVSWSAFKRSLRTKIHPPNPTASFARTGAMGGRPSTLTGHRQSQGSCSHGTMRIRVVVAMSWNR